MSGPGKAVPGPQQGVPALRQIREGLVWTGEGQKKRRLIPQPDPDLTLAAAVGPSPDAQPHALPYTVSAFPKADFPRNIAGQGCSVAQENVSATGSNRDKGPPRFALPRLDPALDKPTKTGLQTPQIRRLHVQPAPQTAPMPRTHITNLKLSLANPHSASKEHLPFKLPPPPTLRSPRPTGSSPSPAATSAVGMAKAFTLAGPSALPKQAMQGSNTAMAPPPRVILNSAHPIALATELSPRSGNSVLDLLLSPNRRSKGQHLHLKSVHSFLARQSPF